MYDTLLKLACTIFNDFERRAEMYYERLFFFFFFSLPHTRHTRFAQEQIEYQLT